MLGIVCKKWLSETAADDTYRRTQTHTANHTVHITVYLLYIHTLTETLHTATRTPHIQPYTHAHSTSKSNSNCIQYFQYFSGESPSSQLSIRFGGLGYK